MLKEGFGQDLDVLFVKKRLNRLVYFRRQAHR